MLTFIHSVLPLANVGMTILYRNRRPPFETRSRQKSLNAFFDGGKKVKCADTKEIGKMRLRICQRDNKESIQQW